jgi:two-component system phosphate regulon sensor histidine kinase PhoR
MIATNAEGQIVLINEAASKLLLVDQPHLKGKPFGAVVRHPDLVDLHDRARASTTPIRRQFETSTDAGRRVVEAHGVKVPPGPSQISRLLVLRDVTDLAEMAAMKAQFVANASHELRTPLATIRAAVDSLSAVETDDAAGLAKLRVILDRHVRRLEEMTKDLLDLHMVESAKFPLRMQPMTLDDLAEWVGSQFCDRASEKGLTLIAKAEGPEHSFASDRKLVELILRNLVENAIKFTPAGGRIACGFETGEAGILMRISDTGCGIRREDQPRVFERFYQTDAARSGDAKLRGTGLGLAIVKHAAERLGAKVELQSDLGRGTTVTVLLPPMTNAAVKS